MAIIPELIKEESKVRKEEDLSLKRYEELKAKKKAELLQKFRRDKIKRNTSVVHDL